VIDALGGTVIEYAGMRKCCGFPIITMNKDASLKQAGRHLGDAVDAHADCLVTPCPLCHLNLDFQQPIAEGVVGRQLNMPILHLPQLVGLALGLEPKELDSPAHGATDVGDRLVDIGGRCSSLVPEVINSVRHSRRHARDQITTIWPGTVTEFLIRGTRLQP